MENIIFRRPPGAAQKARSWKNWGLNARRTILLAAINVLLTWGIVIALLSVTYRHEVENWERIALTTSLTTGAYTEQALGAADLVLRSMQDWVQERHVASEDDLKQLGADRALFDTLRYRTLDTSHLATAAISDLKGDIVVSTASYPAPKINIADRESFVRQFAPNPPALVLSGVVVNRVTQRPTFFLSRKLTSSAGEALGVAMVSVDVGYFSKFFRQVARDGEAAISLFRSDGTLLATTLEIPTLLGERFDQAVPLELVRRGLSGTVRQVGGAHWSDPTDERRRLIAPRKVESFPVFVSVSIGESVYLANWGKAALFLIGAAVALTILTIYVAGRFLAHGERTERADRIARERRLLRTLLDTPAALCAILDRRGQILYCNERFADIVVASGDHGTPITLDDPALLGGDTALRFATEGMEESIELDLRLERPDRPVRYFHFTMSRQTLPDLGSCAIMVGHDETTRHQLQLAVAQSAKMMTLGELSTGLAHELSQPLNVIRMAAQNALTETAPATTETDETAGADFVPLSDSEFRSFAAGKLTRIMAQVDRAAEIISRMRIFGRAPAGPPQSFDARDAVRSVLALAGPRILGMGISIVEHLGEEELFVRGYQNLLEQVVLNLLMNARDAVNELASGPKVIELRAIRSNHRVLLQVIDNGPGVADEIRERIFEPFFTAKPLGKGTGLGLALSFGIVREAGGILSLLEDSGRGGSVFQIDLPCADVESQREQTAAVAG